MCSLGPSPTDAMPNAAHSYQAGAHQHEHAKRVPLKDGSSFQAAVGPRATATEISTCQRRSATAPATTQLLQLAATCVTCLDCERSTKRSTKKRCPPPRSRLSADAHTDEQEQPLTKEDRRPHPRHRADCTCSSLHISSACLRERGPLWMSCVMKWQKKQEQDLSCFLG